MKEATLQETNDLRPAAALHCADESLFRLHFENLPGPAYLWRRAEEGFDLIGYNRAASERGDAAAVGALGRGAGGDPAKSNDLQAGLRACLDSRAVTRHESDLQCGPGDVRRVVHTLVPVAADILVHHVEDITDGYRAAQALRESEARARAFLEANPDMLARVSRDGRYLAVHIPENVAQYLPMSREDFLGRTVMDLFDPEFAREHDRHRSRALETGEMQRWQYARLVDGKTRYLDARFIRSGNDEVVVAITDVTDRVDREREAVNAIDRERNRIGRDLHDGLGQLLTGIKLILEPMRKQFSAAAAANLEQALELVDLAIAQASELAKGLSPVPKQGGTIAAALEELTRHARHFFHVDCSVTARNVPADLTDECAINLYRIAQEAITNAVKHGKAGKVEVRCAGEDDRLVLEIEDDGFGGAGPKGSGMGLRIMRYRARAIGGELSIDTGMHGGTVVRCFCPLPAGRGPRPAPAE
jgi:two-component system sensor kinase FixL